MSWVSRLRRSAPATAAGTAAGASPGVGVPHSGQNRKPGSMALPQVEQASGARVPHAWQNCFPGISSL
jgi:hypothetical protein